MAIAASTAAVSSQPCVSGEQERQRDAAATIVPRAHGQVAGGQRQPRLVDAVDVDVLELVEADDEDVDRERGDQRPDEVEGGAPGRQRAELVGGDGEEPGDVERRSDDGVRAREAPQRRDRPARRRSGRRAAGAHQRRPRRARRRASAPIGTNTAPAAEPRRSPARPARSAVMRLRTDSRGVAAAGEAPGAGLRRRSRCRRARRVQSGAT